MVAGRLAACAVDRQTPFFLSCSLGGTDAFRGYQSTQHIDNSLTSLQLAYRGLFGESRFGYAVFAGAGLVADDFADLPDSAMLAAAGLGARLRVSRELPVELSVDLAINKEGESTTYVYVGQRF